MPLCAADKSKDELEQEPEEEDEQQKQQEAQARVDSAAASESAIVSTPNGPSGAQHATATGGTGANEEHDGAEDTHQQHEHQHVHAASSLEGAGTGSGSGPQQQAARAGKKLSMPAAHTGPQAGAQKLSPEKQLHTSGSSAAPNNTHSAGRVVDIISPLHVRPLLGDRCSLVTPPTPI